MRLKRPEKAKNEKIQTRCTTAVLNLIKSKANIYCEGNLSEYVIYASLNFVPGKEDFEDEIKTPAKKPGKIKR